MQVREVRSLDPVTKLVAELGAREDQVWWRCAGNSRRDATPRIFGQKPKQSCSMPAPGMRDSALELDSSSPQRLIPGVRPLDHPITR